MYALAAMLALSSCNLPDGSPSQSEMMTAAAMTVQSALASTPLSSPTAELPTEVLSTPTVFTKPVVSVGDVTNCRSGPGKDYERITQISPGQSIEIVGILPPGYWLVSTADGICWVAVEFATPAGSYQAVPTVTAPPTPTGNAPEAPTFPKNGWSYYCFGTGQADVTLNWNDKADNETGYRILRNGEVIAELPANSTSFSESITLLSGQSATYQIEAYNLVGATRSAPITLSC